ncbi:hypothetical protein KIW84_022491 [Lathyrus oleraceus]|uniref:Uncharacterized protein n=1 Tax=Pisum sativum TaxID=3888 RepID=A0A9D4YAP1_PEA|nr:hypothetical protein KIW84_022491 [Pisum sativum]
MGGPERVYFAFEALACRAVKHHWWADGSLRMVAEIEKLCLKENKTAYVKLERIVLDQSDHPGIVRLYFTFSRRIFSVQGTAPSSEGTGSITRLASIDSFDSKWQPFLDPGESVLMISMVKKLPKKNYKQEGCIFLPVNFQLVILQCFCNGLLVKFLNLTMHSHTCCKQQENCMKCTLSQNSTRYQMKALKPASAKDPKCA